VLLHTEKIRDITALIELACRTGLRFDSQGHRGGAR